MTNSFDNVKQVVDCPYPSNTGHTYKAVLVANLKDGCIIYHHNKLVLTNPAYIELHVLSDNMSNPIYDKLIKEASK